MSRCVRKNARDDWMHKRPHASTNVSLPKSPNDRLSDNGPVNLAPACERTGDGCRDDHFAGKRVAWAVGIPQDCRRADHLARQSVDVGQPACDDGLRRDCTSDGMNVGQRADDDRLYCDRR